MGNHQPDSVSSVKPGLVKRLILPALLGHTLIASLCFGQQQAPTQSRTYDRQKNLTTVGLALSRISGDRDHYHSLDFSVYYTYPGQTKQTPEQMNFELVVVDRSRRLNSDLYVVFVADGEELHFGSNRSAIARPVPGRQWLGERMIFLVPLEKFRKLASARELAVKLGAVVFPFPDESRAALRSFADSIK